MNDSKKSIEIYKEAIEKFEKGEKNADNESIDFKKSLSIYELMKENLNYIENEINKNDNSE